MTPLKPYTRVRILFGPHAGKIAEVLATAECGHDRFDIVVLRLTGATAASGGVHHTEPGPVHLFRFAVEEFRPDDLCRPIGDVPDHLERWPEPTSNNSVPRVQRFVPGDRVRVIGLASRWFSAIGQIAEVTLSWPAVVDGTGRAEGPFSARYRVRFRTAGPEPVSYGELYDCELAPAPKP